LLSYLLASSGLSSDRRIVPRQLANIHRPHPLCIQYRPFSLLDDFGQASPTQHAIPSQDQANSLSQPLIVVVVVGGGGGINS